MTYKELLEENRKLNLLNAKLLRDNGTLLDLLIEARMTLIHDTRIEGRITKYLNTRGKVT